MIVLLLFLSLVTALECDFRLLRRQLHVHNLNDFNSHFHQCELFNGLQQQEWLFMSTIRESIFGNYEQELLALLQKIRNEDVFDVLFVQTCLLLIQRSKHRILNLIMPLHSSNALSLAVKMDSLPLISMLLEAGANVEAFRAPEHSPLMTAIEFKKFEAAEALIRAGASVNDSKLIRSCLWTRNSRMLWLLMRECPDLRSDSLDLFMDALEQEETLATLLLDFTSVPDLTVAFWGAAAHGKPGILEKILWQVALNVKTQINDELNVMTQINEGLHAKDPINDETALHKAARSGSVECVRLLLKAGADAQAKDSQSFTPLFTALERGQIEAAKLLLPHSIPIQNEQVLLALTARTGDFELFEEISLLVKPESMQDFKGPHLVFLLLDAIEAGMPSSKLFEQVLGVSINE